MDEIVEAFGFRQIELAVLERAAREFAGLSSAKIFRRGQRSEQRGQHRASAMNVKLGDVFAGRAGWCGKPEHDCIVDWLMVRVTQQSPRCHSR